MFHLEIRPDPSDIDELDHVSNLVYLRWVQQVAVAHSDAAGWNMDAYRRLGAVWIVRRHELDYRRPALLGDVLTLTTWVSDWKRASCWRETRVRRGDEELVHARTRWALVELSSGRPCPIPDELRESFREPEPDAAH